MSEPSIGERFLELLADDRPLSDYETLWTTAQRDDPAAADRAHSLALRARGLREQDRRRAGDATQDEDPVALEANRQHPADEARGQTRTQHGPESPSANDPSRRHAPGGGDPFDRLGGHGMIATPGLGLVQQARHPARDKAAPNPRHRFRRQVEPRRNLHPTHPRRTQQHDAGATHGARRGGRARDQGVQLVGLLASDLHAEDSMCHRQSRSDY